MCMYGYLYLDLYLDICRYIDIYIYSSSTLLYLFILKTKTQMLAEKNVTFWSALKNLSEKLINSPRSCYVGRQGHQVLWHQVVLRSNATLSSDWTQQGYWPSHIPARYKMPLNGDLTCGDTTGPKQILDLCYC